MIPQFGLIVGSSCQLPEALLMAPDREIETPYGPVKVKISEKWAVICRSGFDGAYLLPHEYRSEANLAAFRALGLSELVGLHSSGSLRPSLAPGMLVCPDDWINFNTIRTTLSGERRHLTPSFSRKVRQKLIDAAWKAELPFENGGTYWQSGGPRLETKAEIKVMSNFADVVGMGLADEANLAQEMDLDYAAICSVDNYANGLGAPNLSDEGIRTQSEKNRAALSKVLDNYSLT
jgi:Purine nucleoside phosphorylase